MMTSAFAVRWDKKGTRRLHVLLVLAMLTSLLAVTGGAAVKQHDRSISVIVQEKPGAGNGPEALVASLGGKVNRKLSIIRGFSATVPASKLATLRSNGSIKAVTEDASVAMFTDYDASGRAMSGATSLGGVSMNDVARLVGADYAWKQGYTGKGIDIALIDTGVTRVPGLTANVVDGPDLSFDSQSPSLAHLDAYGHGTHMAGLIAGNDAATSTYADLINPANFEGIAPGSRIVNVKVGATDGAADVSQVIAAIDWVVKHKNDPGMNIRVLNLSFGTDSIQAYGLDPLSYAAEVAWRKGIVVVAAVGNDGTNLSSIANPASDPFILAVGAQDAMGTLQYSDDVVPDFASRSTTKRNADIIAPGAHILGLRVPGSFIDESYPGAVVQERFFLGSGTSQSAAITSGFVALFLQKFPKALPDDVKSLIKSTARPLALSSTKPAHGRGLINGGKLFASVFKTAALQSKTYAYSTGTGTLQGARGSLVVNDGFTNLTGEKDIFGKAWNGKVWAPASLAGTAWTGGTWNGSLWSGSEWSGGAWPVVLWTSPTWSGRPWWEYTLTTYWDGQKWTGTSWTGRRWSDAAWAGRRWSGAGWY